MWKIHYTSLAEKFIQKQKIERNTITETILKTLKFLAGENLNIDIKKLKGEWRGFYRIRQGKLRIILSINFEKQEVVVKRIDFRGSIYK